MKTTWWNKHIGMSPRTRNADENSRGGKMIAATEAFPYDLLSDAGNQQSHYTCTKTIADI